MASLQEVVTAGVVSALPSPDPAVPVVKVACLSRLHLRFPCGLAGVSDLPPIWDAVVQRRGNTEGLATLNQALMRGLPSFRKLFGGGGALQRLPPTARLHAKCFAHEPLPGPIVRWRGGFTLCLTSQGTVEASTCGGADASLLAHQIYGRLASADSLRTDARVRLAAILSVEEALFDLGTFSPVASHLFSAGGRHLSTVTELLRIIERLEELHTKGQGIISSPHIATTLLFGVLQWWSLYLNRCMAVLALKSLDTPGCHFPFYLEPILDELEGGQYVVPILPTALGDLVSKTGGRGGMGSRSSISSSGDRP